MIGVASVLLHGLLLDQCPTLLTLTQGLLWAAVSEHRRRLCPSKVQSASNSIGRHAGWRGVMPDCSSACIGPRQGQGVKVGTRLERERG